ncbi:hypothetical protein VTK56DRAFT_10131 [Thermocarpiscus australiensis]
MGLALLDHSSFNLSSWDNPPGAEPGCEPYDPNPGYCTALRPRQPRSPRKRRCGPGSKTDTRPTHPLDQRTNSQAQQRRSPRRPSHRRQCNNSLSSLPAASSSSAHRGIKPRDSWAANADARLPGDPDPDRDGPDGGRAGSQQRTTPPPPPPPPALERQDAFRDERTAKRRRWGGCYLLRWSEPQPLYYCCWSCSLGSGGWEMLWPDDGGR